jgi:hypothetical protein
MKDGNPTEDSGGIWSQTRVFLMVGIPVSSYKDDIRRVGRPVEIRREARWG